jgi:predicted phage replisome organizer
MAESKKYFWLKLKRDFFKRHDIQIIESMPNGKDYILFYLKLLCESVDHEGNLRFSEQIPYNEQMLATITHTNPDIVKSAIQVFTELHMMEILDDGTLYMNEVTKMLGFETEWAKKQREYRDKKRQREDNVLSLSDKSKSIEIELEKEKESEIEIEKETEYASILSLYHSICVSYPHCPSLTSSHIQRLDSLLQTYSIEDFKTMFQKAEQSSFLKGNNERKWSACLGWMIKDNNMQKILAGEYD